MKDRDILKLYYQGWVDQKTGKLKEHLFNPNLDGRAYTLGVQHAKGEGDTHLTNEEIIKLLKKY
jgi:hypothetical protein